MQFLLDECVPKSTLDTLLGAGFDAIPITELILPGSEDLLVAATGDALGATIVSHDRDFKRIIARVPDGNVRRFRSVHLLKMECKPDRIGQRIIWAKPLIDAELTSRTTMKDRRMIIWIATDFIRVWR